MARYFKLATANNQDKEQLMQILQNKIFFPEATSNPALPAQPEPDFEAGNDLPNFDYRQFFKFMYSDKDGSPVVKTRSEYSVSDQNTYIVPTSAQTTRYRLTAAPTITEFNHIENMNGQSTLVTADVFLQYNQKMF